MGGGSRAEEVSISREQDDTYNSVILQKRERPWELRSYADVARENIKRPLGKIDS